MTSKWSGREGSGLRYPADPQVRGVDRRAPGAGRPLPDGLTHAETGRKCRWILGVNLEIKILPATPTLPPRRPGGKPRRGKRTFTPLRPLYKVENLFARLGMWRRLSRSYEQTALGAQTWLEVACVAYLCGRLRVEPT